VVQTIECSKDWTTGREVRKRAIKSANADDKRLVSDMGQGRVVIAIAPDFGIEAITNPQSRLSVELSEIVWNVCDRISDGGLPAFSWRGNGRLDAQRHRFTNHKIGRGKGHIGGQPPAPQSGIEIQLPKT